MKTEVKLVQEKMTERQVREAIEKASRTAREYASFKGEKEISHEQMREKMIQNAERDRKEGKI
jgi:hypothetical protein